MRFKSKIPKNADPIRLADEIKRGMTRKFLMDIEKIKKANKIRVKKRISKEEAIMIADVVKSGMSIEVMEDLEELEKARSKVQTAI